VECTGKSILPRQAAESRHTEFVPVEGSAGLTPARLIGSSGPALVLEQGYRPESFSGGQLVRGDPIARPLEATAALGQLLGAQSQVIR
jgi:hypothetical protein